MSHELSEGVKLKSVRGYNAHSEDELYYEADHHSSVFGAKSITVVEQLGQMAPVAWAKVIRNDGKTELVNLAQVESVVLAE